MKCPHCGHETGFLRFAMTVINPWKIRCSECSGHCSIGKKGNLILLVTVIIGAAVGIATYDKSLIVVGAAGCALGLIAEYLIWAMDEPVSK